MQSDDNQRRQYDECNQVEHIDGLYICTCVKCLLYCIYSVQYIEVIAITYVYTCLHGSPWSVHTQ